MEPIITTDNKQWSSIDIFLFSNGQQYSPPRKYHLRSEELQWWGTTISYLGRTHYGSGHSSIELYSIDGTKINGPLELSNGAAYVAVEPPDSFVNTGYEEYLLRASRSWEKRLAQKSYNHEALNSDFKLNKDPAEQSHTEDISMPDNNVETASLNVPSNTVTSPQKTRTTKPYQRIPRKSIAGSKQIQKKKSFDTHGAVLKKICAETDKVFPCPRKTSLKKSGCVNQKPSTIVPRKLNESNKEELSSCCRKRGSLKTEFDPKTEASKPLDTCDMAPVAQTQIVDKFFNIEESDLMSEKNDVNSEHYEMHNRIEENVPILDRRQTNNDDGLKNNSSNKLKEITDHRQSGTLSQNYYQNNEIENALQENNPVINCSEDNNQLYDTTLNRRSEKQVIDEYVAQMNKGGLLLLKLKVKLKDCKTILNRDKSKNIQTDTSISNFSKTEKTSQVDINISFSGELLKSNDQQYTQNKSLQSVLNKLYTEESDQVGSKNPRIIILQCACRENFNTKKCCMCDTFHECEFENKKGEVNNNQKLDEASARCHNESLRNSRDENAMNTDITNQSANEDRPSRSNGNGTRVKDLAQKFESSNRTMRMNDNGKNRISNDISTNKDQRQSILVSTLNGSASTDGVTKNQIREESYDSNSKSICSKSTQTDWSNVLLEARLHEDDNYTFHLPSLYVLKQYNL